MMHGQENIKKCHECLRVEEVVSSSYSKLLYVGNVRPSSLPDVWVRFSFEIRVIFTRCVRTVMAKSELQHWFYRTTNMARQIIFM